MDTAKINTLKQVNDAIQVVDDAVENASSAAEQMTLQRILTVLENIKNNIISQSEQRLIKALAGNNTELSQLADQINKDAAQLDKVADTIKKVGDTIGVLINITAAAASAGLL